MTKVFFFPKWVQLGSQFPIAQKQITEVLIKLVP